MAVLHKPRLLIADEPTSALDAITQSEILDLFRSLNRELNMAMLFVSHDLLAVASLCSRIAILQRGQIVETGTTEQMFRDPRTEDTRALARKPCCEIPAPRPNSLRAIQASRTSTVQPLSFTGRAILHRRILQQLRQHAFGNRLIGLDHRDRLGPGCPCGPSENVAMLTPFLPKTSPIYPITPGTSSLVTNVRLPSSVASQCVPSIWISRGSSMHHRAFHRRDSGVGFQIQANRVDMRGRVSRGARPR